jgi:phage/plasmid-associated DNA primase
VLEQFFQERCYFYPEAIVSISDLYEAWEKWCDETGETATTKRKFTKDVRERGVVKNIGDGKIGRDTRAFTGISLSPKFQSPHESPANAGVVKDSETENLESQNFSRNRISHREFSNFDEFQSPGEFQSPDGSPPPSSGETWTADGLEIHYMPEGE